MGYDSCCSFLPWPWPSFSPFTIMPRARGKARQALRGSLFALGYFQLSCQELEEFFLHLPPVSKAWTSPPFLPLMASLSHKVLTGYVTCGREGEAGSKL